MKQSVGYPIMTLELRTFERRFAVLTLDAHHSQLECNLHRHYEQSRCRGGSASYLLGTAYINHVLCNRTARADVAARLRHLSSSVTYTYVHLEYSRSQRVVVCG